MCHFTALRSQCSKAHTCGRRLRAGAEGWSAGHRQERGADSVCWNQRDTDQGGERGGNCSLQQDWIQWCLSRDSGPSLPASAHDLVLLEEAVADASCEMERHAGAVLTGRDEKEVLWNIRIVCLGDFMTTGLFSALVNNSEEMQHPKHPEGAEETKQEVGSDSLTRSSAHFCCLTTEVPSFQEAIGSNSAWHQDTSGPARKVLCA
ncbi:uncharacterized protein LOC115635509 [Gopherus evgoodei]|uniref:uncharacterized protein LOC115635509 n=1 Tax=Gopherus evgoodei TaxID=1825980 RepID=UPI0011D026B9|nr:uncharacterized protein LOC115635509 [Gopherus evgoodei]